jgi:protocatechuate 3,4-dioxygenase beta subunit
MKFANSVLATLILLQSFCYAGQTPQTAKANAPSTITITEKDEPGERLMVSGKVIGEDGKPLRGVSVYVYHTDVKGYYSPTNDNRNPRLKGYMRTDAQGRYAYSTIRPGHYPNQRIPAHIHYVVNADGYKERVFEILFEGDEFIEARMRERAAEEGSAFSIRPLSKDQQGIWQCTQDIKLQRL